MSDDLARKVALEANPLIRRHYRADLRKRGNLFDSASPAVQANMIRDLKTMALTELKIAVDEDQARRIARKILENAEERDDLYRVPTDRLARLIREDRED